MGSPLAGEIHGLQTLAEGIQDNANNTTRFLVMSRQRIEAEPGTGNAMTSFVFQVRNVPAALYKAMGGFATNKINMVKLESYMTDGSFTATQFYAEIDGHPGGRHGGAVLHLVSEGAGGHGRAWVLHLGGSEGAGSIPPCTVQDRRIAAVSTANAALTQS